MSRPISWMANMFCGEEIGLVMPPRLDASAMPETGITHLPESQRVFCLLDCAAANERAIVAQERASIIGCRVGRQLAAARPSVMHTHIYIYIYIYICIACILMCNVCSFAQET
jgi:hypothetical protein